MKFKINTKHKIKDNLICGKTYGNCEYSVNMCEYEGDTVKIIEIIEYLPKRYNYRIKEDNGKWLWNFKMFEVK